MGSVRQPERDGVAVIFEREADDPLELVNRSEPSANHLVTAPMFRSDPASIIDLIVQINL